MLFVVITFTPHGNESLVLFIFIYIDPNHNNSHFKGLLTAR